LEHDDFADDVSLVLQCVETVGDPVLEVGCGTGRLIEPIARAGYRVTGIDRSPDMLARARSRLREPTLKRRVTLVEGDMTAAGSVPGGPFGIVLFSLNGLMHVSTPEEQRAALTAARRTLDPRGQLLIDLQNPSPGWLHDLNAGVSHEGSWRSDEGLQIDKFAHRSVASARQIIDTTVWYDSIDAEGVVRRVASSFQLRYLHAHELELMLELAGFAEWRIYGSYDLDPFTDDAERLIVLAEVTAS
jgi:SAM-dependent methyltransferase